MKQTLRLTRVEIRRLLMNKKTYILMCINILFIALGYNNYIKNLIGTYIFSSFTSGSMNYIVYPFCLGGFLGALLWGISLILDADRLIKLSALGMVKTYAREEDISRSRVLAYSIISGITFVLSSIIYLPLCINKMQYMFDIKLYLIYVVISFVPGIIMTLLLSESLYMISRNISISIIIMLILSAVQFTPLVMLNGFLRWNAPQFIELSDAFVSEGTIRFQIYSRVLLIIALVGIYSFSVMFVRKYQFGALKSFLISSKNPLKYISLIVFGGMTAFMIIKQPFIDHSPVVEWDEPDDLEFDNMGEFAKKDTDVSFNTLLGTLKGKTEIILTEVAGDKLEYRIRSGIKIKNVTLDGEKLEYYTDYDLDDNNNINLAVMKGVIKNPEKKTGKLVIEYEGYPALSNSLFRKEGYSGFDSIGQSYMRLDSESLSPQILGLGGENESFYINVPADHNPSSWGIPLDKVQENDDGTIKWKVEGYNPQIVSARTSVDKIDYDSYDTTFEYGKKYSKIMKENDMDTACSDVMNYCDSHFGGIKNSWDVSSIRIQQLSNDQPGGGAGYGWITMDEEFLSPESLNNDKAGANMKETFMHEIIHLFWGDLGCWCEEEDIWSAEGLTVFTTYRIVKEKYGELYAKQYYVDKWKEEVKYQNNNFYFRHPEYLDKLPESYKSVILDSESSINHYCRMPLMLLKAEEKLGGEEALDEVLKKLYEQGDAFGVAERATTFQDFLDISGLTEEDLEID